MAQSMFTTENQGEVTMLTLTLNHSLHGDNENFMKSFDELIDKGNKKIVLNLSETNYVSSLILASLVYVQKKAKDSGGDLVFCGVKERVLEIIQMTNLDKVFTIVGTKEEALAKFK